MLNTWDILICTISGREEFLKKLLSVLEPQRTNEVGILINYDSREKEIGTKRNELVNQSTAKYISFIDDDDLVATDYVAKILDAMKKSPDCIGIEGVFTRNGKKPQKFVYSLKHASLFIENNVLHRPPTHCNPILREIAVQVPFPEISFGEDSFYSKRICPLLKTEVYVSGPLYYYQYQTQNPFRRYILYSKMAE